MVLMMKLSICLSLILTFQLNKKSPKIIIIPLIPILRVANLLENLLILIDMVEENKMVNEAETRDISDRIIKNLPKF